MPIEPEDPYLVPRPTASSRRRDPLDVIAHYESGGKNIHQNVVPLGGGYNPSVGRVTGPSSAQGPWQITNSTWRKRAPRAGVDTKQYPTAMSAPIEVQRSVAAKMFEETGYRDWAPYNSRLRAAIRRGEAANEVSQDDSYLTVKPQPTSPRTQTPDTVDDPYLVTKPSGQTQPASERQTPSRSPNPPAPPKQPPLSSVPSRSRQGGGIFGRREVQEAVRQGIRQPVPPPTGAGDLRRATRGDEARTQRLLELQREEARRESPTAGLRPSIDTRRATQRAARRLSTEEADTTRRQRLEPEVSRLTERYRKQIREAQNRGIGPEQWLNETAAKGVVGLLELGSGVIRGAKYNPLAVGAESSADQIAAHAEALQRAAEAEGADRNYVSQATQNILAGTVSTAPEMVAISLGVPAPIAFGAGGATRSVGRGEQPEQVAKSGLHGAATGAVFEIPGAVGIRNSLAKVGTIGVGTGAVEAASGQPLSKAVEAGATNALLAGAGEIGRGSRRQPSSLTRGLEREVPRERVEPDADIAARLRGVEQKRDTAPENIPILPGQAETPVPRQARPTVYHAGTTPFEQLDVSRTKVGTKGRGLYFATSPEGTHIYEMAKRGTRVDPANIKSAQLDMRNPLDLTDPASTQRFTGEVEGLLSDPAALTRAAELSRQWGRATTPEELQANLRSLVDAARSGDADAIRELVGWNPNLTATAKTLGYDGIIDTAEQVVFDRSQIKGVKGESQIQTKPPVETQRAEVEPAAGTPPAATESLVDAVPRWENISTGVSPESAPARFYHRDFGEVTESPNQRRVGKGRMRVIDEFGAEHVIKRAAMTGRGNERAVPVREAAPERIEEVRVEGERQQVPPSGSSGGVMEGASDSTTSARKAQLASDRAALDLPELPPAERKSWQRSLSEARPETATRLADEVLNRPRALNDSETASLVVRAQQVKNEHATKLKEIANAADDTAIQSKRAELETLEREFDQLTQATKLSGTEKGRALAAQKLTINQDYDLVSLVARFKASAGRAPTAKERTRIEELSRWNAELEAKLAEVNDRLVNQRIQKEIDRTQRRSTRTETKAQLDAEWADLTKQFAEIRQREASFFKSEKGEFDPAALKLISRMVRNRVRAGVVNATQLVDDIHAIVGGDKRELRDAISGYRTQPAKQQPDLQRQLNALKSELRQLSSTEDIAAGRRAPRQEGPQAAFRRDEARQRALQKQITDLEGQMASGQFRERSTPEPPRYTAETLRLQKQLEDVRLDYERMKYRATASTTTRLGHEAVKAINSVKTLKSIGDISAVFRQGGFYGLSHPLEGLLKPSKAMLDSFTELGYRNVEAAIKADPAYDTLKRAGVEFTGVDPRHPHLSLREEGFLGGEYLDYIPGLKQVKNFSERTFVSFLDAQRLSMGKQMLDALTPEQRANPRELQSIAKLVNAGTGRGNLGARGNSAAPVLNLVMFSPRLLASRVQLLNNMISPRKLATMPPGVRKRMIADNVKFLAATTLILGLAKAAGAGINLDPDDSDFLKIRAGNTTYDTLTGLQQPLRYFISMGRAIKADITGDETYAGQSKGELTGRFARSKLSPSAGTALDYVTGKDFMGRKFNVKTAAKELVMPLPAKDVTEAMQKEGLWGGAKATPTFVGIGVGNYPPPAERAGTHAEKLARRMVIRRLPDEARTQEEIDIDTKRSELRARARRGEDVSADIQALGPKITDRQAKAILAARNRTRLQEDVNRLGIKDALLVYSVANPQQRAELKSLLTRKADLVATLPLDEQVAVIQKLNEYGLSGRGVRISRPSRASRESRQSR